MALHIDVSGPRGSERLAVSAWCDECIRPVKGAGVLVLPDREYRIRGGIAIACGKSCAAKLMGDDWTYEDDVSLELWKFLRMLPVALDIDMDAEERRELDELQEMLSPPEAPSPTRAP